MLHDQQAAGIGDGDRVDRRRRHAACDADRGAWRALRPGERRHGTEARGRGDAAQQRQRQAEQAAMADEVAAADTAVDETVDEVIFERRAIAPDEVENAIILAHGFDPFPCFLWLTKIRDYTVSGRQRPVDRDCSTRFCPVHPVLGADVPVSGLHCFLWSVATLSDRDRGGWLLLLWPAAII
ncbi:hypothetical protein [Mesorhizobium sp. ORM16]|uniref:hypothetical protein n=1 Tax=Mesorhizobium sp. ORM16 TaxID=3376989 RepID=UPI003857EB2C